MSLQAIAMQTLRRRNDRISKVERLTLDPLEFCKRWCDYPEDERGYKKACVLLLARVVGVEPRTAERWISNPDSCPRYAKLALRKQDVINQIRILVRSPDDIEE